MVEEQKEVKALVEKIPGLIKTVNAVTEEAIRRIESGSAPKGEKEVLKQEAIRDITLKVAEKIESLWLEVERVNTEIGLEMSKGDIKVVERLKEEEKIIRKYANYFVKPLVELLDVARKANVDVYEMRYGKKVQSASDVEKFDDFIQRKMKENKEKMKIVDVVAVEEVKDGN